MNHVRGVCVCVCVNRNAYRVLVGKRIGKGQLEDQGVDGSTILNWILRK